VASKQLAARRRRIRNFTRGRTAAIVAQQRHAAVFTA
jgi:hypothetical protein